MPASTRHKRRTAIRRNHANHPGTPHEPADPQPDELPDLATQRGFIPRNQRHLHRDDNGRIHTSSRTAKAENKRKQTRDADQR